MSWPAPRWRLFPKYATLIVALVGGMLAASSAIGLYFSWREIVANLEALQGEKAAGAAERIERYVREIDQQMSWTAFPRLDTSGDALEQRRVEYQKLLRQAPAITELIWIADDGHERLHLSRLAMDVVDSRMDRSQEPSFKGARDGRTWFGPVHFRKGTEPYMAIARPAGGDGGVTVAEVNLKFVWDVVSRLKVGRDGVAYAVDGEGTLIAHPDISLVLKKTDMSALPQVAAALRPGAPGGEARDLAGRAVLAAHAPIPSLGWVVFVETPRREALEPLYAALWRGGLVLAAGLLLSALASFVLARALVRPIRQLGDGAARIGSGDLDHRIEVRTGDELQDLARRFNEMAAALQASHAGLERKVEERTAALQAALEQQTAIADVLRVMSASVADSRRAFDEIVASAQRLFAVSTVGILLVRDDGQLHLAAHSREMDEGLRSRFPMPLAGSATERAVREQAVLHLPDVAAVPDSPDSLRGEVTRAAGSFAIGLAPMIWEGRGIGSVFITQPAGQAFTLPQLRLLRTFADQAAIAIQNSRLFHELQDKSAQLEAANRHKSEFLANMSHELRTPLDAVIGFSVVLIEQMFGEVNAKQLEYLRDIHTSGQLLLSLINDVLDLSKIEAGRMELELSAIDLGLLLEHSSTLVRERAQRHGLALTVTAGEGLGDWVADARKLKQVIVNLLSNAVKFTPTGGRVAVRARRLEDGSAEIVVQDTGIGIAPEDHALVFEEFRQVGRDTLRKAEGTGLGLALVKRFVELHRGRVVLESALGQGSTFTITLPPLTLEALAA